MPSEGPGTRHPRRAVVAEDETERVDLVDAGEQPAHVKVPGIAPPDRHDVVDTERRRGRVRRDRQRDERHHRSGPRGGQISIGRR